MSEPESLRQIAARLIQEHREKKRNSLSSFLDQVPPDVLGALSVLKDSNIQFTEQDRKWLKKFRIDV